MTALPLLRHSAPPSMVTLGRDSKMKRMVPMGTLTREILRPSRPFFFSSTRPSGIGQGRR